MAENTAYAGDELMQPCLAMGQANENKIHPATGALHAYHTAFAVLWCKEFIEKRQAYHIRKSQTLCSFSVCDEIHNLT